MDTIRRQINKALKIIFSFGVKFLKKGDFDIARQAFEIVARESEEKERKGFLSKIFKRSSLRAKAEHYLKEIPLWQARAEEKRKVLAPVRIQAEAEKRKKTEERRIKEEGKKKKDGEKEKFQGQVKQREERVEERKHLRREELQWLFEKTLDCYNRNEIEPAAKLSEILLNELGNEQKKVGFIEKIGIIAPLIRKTKRILNGIQKKRREEEVRKRQIQKLKEVEEMIKKQKEEIGEPEDVEKQKIEKQKEGFVKKYEEGLKARKDEITKKYEKELERQMNELFKKQKELKAEERELEELERKFEKRKTEIKEKYEQEFETAKKLLKERQAEELAGWEEKLEVKEEGLKSRQGEAGKIQEAPAEVLTEEEGLRKEEYILETEEQIKRKRKLIEEETKRIEQEEIRRRELEERRKEAIGKEETEAEKEKRRVWLEGAIRKEKEMMAPEETERKQREKAASLNTLFGEAIFYYKEKNLDRAIEIFQELKKELPEPEKEPGFFSRIFGKAPLFIQIEDYISRIEKEKILEEKKKIREIRERARIASGKKPKARYKFFSEAKRKISKWLPASPLVILRKFLFLPPLVAIDISDYSIELLRLNNKLSILNYGRVIIKEGIVREGKIKNQKELSLSFKLAVNQAGFKSFRPKQGPILRGIVSVPEYKTNVQTFTLESRDNIFEKVKEEIKKTVPFSIDELYWDYLESGNEKSDQTKILVVAVLKDVIDEQIYFLKSSGVEPVIFDIEAASVGRALLSEKAASEKAATLILDIGARVTNINIFDQRGFIDSSTAISSAGHSLIDKIGEYFGVSKEEAGTIISIKGFHKEDNIILEALEEGMERIVRETKEAIKHYQKITGNEIKKMILSGGTVLFPEIDNFLRGHFQGIEIEIGDPLKKIKRRGGIDSNRAVFYANSLGLALRSIVKDPAGEGINLLPGKIKEKEKKVYWQRHRQRLIIIEIILALLIVIAALLIYLYV